MGGGPASYRSPARATSAPATGPVATSGLSGPRGPIESDAIARLRTGASKLQRFVFETEEEGGSDEEGGGGEGVAAHSMGDPEDSEVSDGDEGLPLEHVSASMEGEEDEDEKPKSRPVLKIDIAAASSAAASNSGPGGRVGGSAAPIEWRKGVLLGTGSFGKVYRGLNTTTGELLAVKEIAVMGGEMAAFPGGLTATGSPSEAIFEGLMREVDMMKGLKHKHIVQYIGTSVVENRLYLLLEYVPGGSLHNMLTEFGPLQEEVIAHYTRQILKGLQYLHRKNIVHRDIKGANILITITGVAKLADFGCSRVLDRLGTPTSSTMDASYKRIQGTISFMAPEVIRQTGYGRKSDIWSVGCVVVEMATGGAGLWSEFSNKLAAMYQVASLGKHPTIPDHLSPGCKAFLARCFIKNPADRPSATDLLKDPWLAQRGDQLPPSIRSPSMARRG